MQIPLQQTKKWQKLQSDLNETTFFEESNDYTILAIIKQTKFGKYLYLPYGPYLKNTKTAPKKALEAIKRLSNAQNAIFARIEPQVEKTADFWAKLPNIRKTTDLNPAETWVLDLAQEKSEILTHMSQGTRTRYNNFAKKGLSVEVSKNPADIKYLVDLQHTLAKTKKLALFPKITLKLSSNRILPLSFSFAITPLKIRQNRPSQCQKTAKSSLLPCFFDDDSTRYYMQSAANLDFRHLPATVALLSTALFDAKDLGLKNFDFWGIAPEDAPKTHPWYGFTEFKKSFGGHEVKYCGTYDLIFQPNRYKIYQFARQINRNLRKIRH